MIHVFQSTRTRVKICGLTRVEDVQAVVQAGADAVGLVFYSPSKRSLPIEQARRLRRSVPAFVNVVALFVNSPADEVRQVIQQVRPDLLQFHGDESPEYCASFDWPYLKAFRVGAPGFDTPQGLLQKCRAYGTAAAWLFDSYSAGYGGSGVAFDTSLLNEVQSAQDSRPLILSGGLKPDTATESIRAVRPYAVDVSSGVEVAPGIKSPEKITAFMKAVAAA